MIEVSGNAGRAPNPADPLRVPPPWRLDKQESTRRALKYRRGAGEVLIVNHDGRGWWDPQSAAKGDVFDLVQHLDPSLSFGQVRQVLRPLVGLSPAFAEALRARRPLKSNRLVAERCNAQPRLRRGSPAWGYLAAKRGLMADVLLAAAEADAVRQGIQGSTRFAHRDEGGAVNHVESRGPAFKGSLSGGRKTLFRLAGSGSVRRIALAEAPIDALSLAALEGIRPVTLYAATGGGMGPGTVASLTGDGSYDQDRVYASVAERHPEAAVVVPPRATAVPSDMAETTPTQRGGHLQHGAECERMAWQNASGHNKRARVEAAMSRWKQVIGDELRAHTDERRAAVVAVAVHALNRMLELGPPSYTRVA